MKNMVFLLIAVFLFSPSCLAGDWPMVRADAARSGYSAESVSPELTLQWIYRSLHEPQPAWEAGDTRMRFDHAFHTVVSGGLLYFGSSVNGKIYALDVETGQKAWDFFTGGPVRFAPAVWKDRLFAVSEDGYLYCLNKGTGEEVWKKSGAPKPDKLLGNDRMVSRWVPRGGPFVSGKTVYFAAGVWPAEGIYFYALDAETGEEIWVNDSAGDLVMLQPHSAWSRSGVSAQGYLAAKDGVLLSPTGRAVPAAFDMLNGTFKYFHLNRYSPGGGSFIAMAGHGFFNGGKIFDIQSGELLQNLKASTFSVIPKGGVAGYPGRIQALQWADVQKTDRKGGQYSIKQLQPLWDLETEHSGVSLIVAGKCIVSGGEASVCMIDREEQNVVQSVKVEGQPLGLAAAGNRIYVSTDRGVIYCFGSNASASPKNIQPNVVDRPYGKNSQNAERAKVILQRSGIREGYALDMGCGDGALAHELARQSDLFVYAIDSNPNMVELARKKLDAAGVYGVSVAVHVENPFAMHYPDYFADLVVSSRAMREGADSVSLGEAKRVRRPCGGVVMIGDPATCEVSIRGLLPGSGEWTHQYTNPANTLCSSDAMVGGPLHMLWYKDNTLRMAQRHGRPPAPLFHEGRIFTEGRDALRAVDAYNGRVLWEYPLPGVLRQYDQDHLMGTAGTGSNFCAADGRIYLHTQDRVLCLDAATGKAAREYDVPTQPNGEPGTWGYIACADGILFGSVADTRHVVKWRYIKGRMDKQYTESHSFFAMDAQTGEVVWRYDAKDSIRHNTICIGEDVVYLIDRPQAEFDRIDYAKRRGEESTHPLGKLVALNKQTGKELWRNEKDIYGTMLALSEPYGMLLMTYQPTRFRLRSEIGGRMAAFHAHSGKRIWDIEADYASRPLINGKTVYAQPGAWDLLTGAKRDFTFERSYGCGTLAASKNMLVFRSGTLSYRDLRHDREVQNYGGIRSGCWIDILPAGGLVLLPNSANGCVCSYLNLASIALQPVD